MEKIIHAAHKGILSQWQLAYFWSLDYWLRTGELPKGDAIPAGVSSVYHVKRMSRSTAYVALDMLRSTLPAP